MYIFLQISLIFLSNGSLYFLFYNYFAPMDSFLLQYNLFIDYFRRTNFSGVIVFKFRIHY